MFPALLENSSSPYLYRRNGGVPQLGVLEKHLKEFQRQLDLLVPDKDNDGLIVIDFESWRPIFRQNFGVLKPYKNLSYIVENKNYPSLSNKEKKEVEERATRNFEREGKRFMLETLRVGQERRPKAQWGYYAFPYCFNGRNNSPEKCPADVHAENERTAWLFKKTDIIMPSVYMSEKMPYNFRVKMVKGRLEEAKKMAPYSAKGKGQIYAYFRYCYTDTLKNLEEEILLGAFKTIIAGGAEGVILWGSSHDLNSKSKCQNFSSYLSTVLGPVVRSFAESPKVLIPRW